MFINGKLKSFRTALSSLAVVGTASFGLWYGAQINSTEASVSTDNTATSAPAAVFPANAGTLGAIPDGTASTTTGCNSPAPRDVTFNVTGVSGPPSNVEVSMTFGSPAHTFRGDIIATLIAPTGASHTVFGKTGVTSATSFGSASDLTGPYNFKDSASGTNWWSEPSNPTAPGDYRTTALGPSTSPAPVTNMTSAFSSVSNPTGTWTLRLQDCISVDTGAISAAALTVNGAAAVNVQHVVDYDGNGKTDYSVTRNSGGAMTWYNNLNGPGTVQTPQWGIDTDLRVPKDYDGDGKTDVAVWRSGTQGVFYILQSATSTVRIENFGQSGDDPTVVGDYDGDGKDDIATYRCPAFGSGDGQCFFFYRGSNNNPSGNITYVPWGFGESSDVFPYPGDFDGDGKYDFCIQRTAPGSTTAGQFVLQKSGGGIEYINWGLNTDFIVPGDYDGDRKTDFCVSRTETINGASGRSYYILERDGGGTGANPIRWGILGDLRTPGDYDGDGKTDIAIWRASAGNPGVFYVLGSTSGPIVFQWGAFNDFPVASFTVH